VTPCALRPRRRRIRTGRGVPIHLQLRSHRLFSENFEEFAHLVDCATLYHTGARHACGLNPVPLAWGSRGEGCLVGCTLPGAAAGWTPARVSAARRALFPAGAVLAQCRPECVAAVVLGMYPEQAHLTRLLEATRRGAAGSALTTFNKGNCDLSPKIIAHRSSATRHEMLVNPPAYAQFCHKAHINDHVRACPRGLAAPAPQRGAAPHAAPWPKCTAGQLSCYGFLLLFLRRSDPPAWRWTAGLTAACSVPAACPHSGRGQRRRPRADCGR